MAETWSGEGKKVENVNIAKWEKGLADIGFTVTRITSYPAGLDDARQQLPWMKRPLELSSLTKKRELGEALYAEFNGYKLVMIPPIRSYFAVNVYDPAGKLLMSNDDYSAPEFFNDLRQNIPALQDKIPHNAAALFQDMFSA